MKLKFNLTCIACPEQYDVSDLDNYGKTVAYVRLRWSTLRAYVPDVGGELIYEHFFDDGAKGCFNDQNEREEYLNRIASAIANHYKQEKYIMFIDTWDDFDDGYPLIP